MKELIPAKQVRLVAGDRIKQARMDQNMSQRELAAHIGVNQTTVTRYEQGVFPLPLETYLNICLVLELDPREAIDPWIRNKAQ